VSAPRATGCKLTAPPCMANSRCCWWARLAAATIRFQRWPLCVVVCAAVSLSLALILNHRGRHRPGWAGDFIWRPAGGGACFTLQVWSAQKKTPFASHARSLLSLEAVFAALRRLAVSLGKPYLRGFIGCCLDAGRHADCALGLFHLRRRRTLAPVQQEHGGTTDLGTTPDGLARRSAKEPWSLLQLPRGRRYPSVNTSKVVLQQTG